MAEEETSQVGGLRNYAIAMLLLGFGIFLANIPLFMELENYQSVIDAFSGVGASSYVQGLQGPYIIMGGAAGILLSAGVGFAGHMQNSQKLGYFSMLLGLIGAGVAIGGAAIFFVYSDAYLAMLEKPFNDPTLTDDDKEILNLFSAVYEQCCFIPYDYITDTNQLPPNDCSLGNTQEDVCPDADWPAVINLLGAGTEDPFGVIATIKEILCQCDDPALIALAESQITGQDICNAWSKISISGQGVDIPDTGLTLEQVIGTLDDYRDDLPIDALRIIGVPLATNETIPNGWGCGLGYAKAMNYFVLLYTEDVALPATYTAFALGAIVLLLSAMLFVFFLMGGNSSSDTFLQYEDDPYAAYGTKKPQGGGGDVQQYNPF